MSVKTSMSLNFATFLIFLELLVIFSRIVMTWPVSMLKQYRPPLHWPLFAAVK